MARSGEWIRFKHGGSQKVVNHFLNPINMGVASYLQDTRHMLSLYFRMLLR